jgi:ABC-type transport system involved in cytochrome c biogenesis permease component
MTTSQADVMVAADHGVTIAGKTEHHLSIVSIPVELPVLVPASKASPLVVKVDVDVDRHLDWVVGCNGEVEVVLELWDATACWLQR